MVDWPHAPVHRFDETGDSTYIVTGATLNKVLLFDGPEKLDLLRDSVLSLADQHEVELQSWSVFANHYHLVAASRGDRLKSFLRRLYATTAISLNAMDGARGRRVWYQYWDTMITNERSWLARMRYVMENPVRHGLVSEATEYAWCSAAWFEATARASFFTTVMSFPIDRVAVVDSF